MKALAVVRDFVDRACVRGSARRRAAAARAKAGRHEARIGLAVFGAERAADRLPPSQGKRARRCGAGEHLEAEVEARRCVAVALERGQVGLAARELEVARCARTRRRCRAVRGSAPQMRVRALRQRQLARAGGPAGARRRS